VSSGHILHAIGHWLVFARVGHSGLLRAALTALVGWVAIGLVNLYLTRKRIAWRAYMDTEVSLHPQQARRIEEARKAEPNGPQVKFRVYIEKPHPDADKAAQGLTQDTEVKDPSLVLLRIRNSGFVPIFGEEFDPLLKFRFPGRRIRGAQPIDASGNIREKLLLLPEDDVPVPAAPPAAGPGTRLLAAFRDLVRPASAARAAAPAANGKKDFIRLSPTVRLGARSASPRSWSCPASPPRARSGSSSPRARSSAARSTRKRRGPGRSQCSARR